MDCLRKSLIGLSFATFLATMGCGTPGAPQPPSLNLPDRVQDLSVSRIGNEVHLHWTMPRRNTDKLLLKGQYTAHLCLEESTTKCTTVADLSLPPTVAGDYRYRLPSAYIAGDLRPLLFRIEIRNHAGRSAGVSDPAITLAGNAPAAITGLAAQVRVDGVVLHWEPAEAQIVRLRRTLLTLPSPAAKKKEERSVLNNAGPEPSEQSMLVRPTNGADPGQALDSTAILDRKYRYTAARILQLQVKNKPIEIESEPSSPITVDTRDVFKPNVPTGLVAIVVSEEKSIDLSWVANTDRDLAGYVVYRREENTSAVRISPAQPIPAPSFRDTSVQAGHRYFYSVSAVDRDGNESARSQEIEEVYPQ